MHDFTAWTDAQRVQHGLPALAIAVVDRQGVVARSVVGQVAVDDVTPVAPNAAFHIGSVTKVFTADVAARLAAKGAVNLDTPVLAWHPAWKHGANAAYDQITLRQLLTHHSGLPAWTDLDEAMFSRLNHLPGTPRQQRELAMREVLALPPVGQPPTLKPVYSNAGFLVAGHAIEVHTSTDWNALLHGQLLDPLHLTCTTGWPQGSDAPRGHVAKGDPPHATPVANPEKLGAFLAPAGDLACTLGDMETWMRAHLAGIEDKPATGLAFALPNTLGFGDTTTSTGQRVLPILGSVEYFTALVVLFPDHDRAVVIMTNVGEEKIGKQAVLGILAALRASNYF